MGKKNLHEAFQEAAARQKAAARASGEPTPMGGGGAAEGASVGSTRASSARDGAADVDTPATGYAEVGGRGAAAAITERAGELLAGFRQPAVLAGLVLAFALGTLVGSRSSRAEAPGLGHVRGDEGGAPTGLDGSGPSAARPSASQASLQPADSGTDAPLLAAGEAAANAAGPTPEQVAAALADKEYVYTIQVLSYRNDDAGMEWATDRVSWMQQLGLPVATPQVIGENIAVLVGAGRTQAELEGLLAEVQSMPDEAQRPGRFQDAMIRRINTLLNR